ncbi:MAG: hypothetical protein JWQ22_2545, partial [Devosia sp.]|nr:hypothetical protein [Devosia sp.]
MIGATIIAMVNLNSYLQATMMNSSSILAIKFETRSGMKVQGNVIPGAPDHAVTIEVTKARKPFAGKTLLFAKTDMLNVTQAVWRLIPHT